MTFSQLQPSQEFVFMRSYARWNEELNRRETWTEAVDRYINFIKEERSNLPIPEKVWRKIKEKILSMDVMPSMRALWAAGPALKQSNITAYNCTFSITNEIEDFAEAIYILCCAAGYGYSVEKLEVEKFPVVQEPNTKDKPTIYVVPDSKEGWADSVKILMTYLYEGKWNLIFDYSHIRPAGARLKTMGGRASGPEPLIQLHQFIFNVFKKAIGRKLTTLECSDIMNLIGDIVVSGGVRRSSEISLSNLDDEEMRHAKDYPFPIYRSMSNNSAIYHEKPTAIDFLQEWAALAKSGTGERGIFNLGSAKKQAPKRRNTSLIRGCNPCVSGDTLLITMGGYERIDSLVDKAVVIWNGHDWSTVVPKITGENQEMVKVILNDGKSLVCTKYHEFNIHAWGEQRNEFSETFVVQAQDLKSGMKIERHTYPILCEGKEVSTTSAYTQGFASVHGFIKEFNKTLLKVSNRDITMLCRMSGKVSGKPVKKTLFMETNIQLEGLNFVPFEWNLSGKLQWLAAVIDCSGTLDLQDNKILIQTPFDNIEFLYNIQKMINLMGVSGKIVDYRQKKFNSCKSDSAVLELFGTDVCKLQEIGLNLEKNKHVKRAKTNFTFNIHVAKVEPAGIANKVYCFTEPKNGTAIFNGIYTKQCGEIMLRDKQCCNLSEVVIKENDDLDDLLDKVETATWIGCIQSTFTDFKYLSPEWKKNAEEERLLGVSLTGQFDNPKILTPDALKAMKSRAIKVAQKASKILEINMPAAITTTKPSGTVSLLVNSSSGCHPRYAKFYIRRFRISSTDPLLKVLKECKVKLSPEVGERKKDFDKARKLYSDNPLETSIEDIRKISKIYVPGTIEGAEWDDEKVNTWVVSFPIKAPKHSIIRSQVSAIQQLEHYKKLMDNWAEHNVSLTVYCRNEDWFNVGNWVYENWDTINGVSFIPAEDHKYELAPFEEIDEEEYQKLVDEMPKIDYTLLSKYELEDQTEGSKEIACTADRCELK